MTGGKVMFLKAVVFDLDGVITSTSREHFLAWAELAAQLGRKLSPHVYDDIKGISRMASLDIVLCDIGLKGNFSEEEKTRLADRKNSIYSGMISRFDESKLAAGAKELFSLLRKNDVLIALGSVSKNSHMLLRNMKIVQHFDYIVDPVRVKNAKPAPDIFLDAARHFSLDPKYCAGVEDAAAGITAIKSAGMYSVGIGDKDYLCEADIVYGELLDMDIFDIDRRMAVRK